MTHGLTSYGYYQQKRDSYERDKLLSNYHSEYRTKIKKDDLELADRAWKLAEKHSTDKKSLEYQAYIGIIQTLLTFK